MIVECRSCHARFRLDERLFKGSKGIRVRCRKCGEITAVRNPEVSFSPQHAEMRSVPTPSRSKGPPPNDKADVALLSSPLPQSHAASPPQPRITGTPDVPISAPRDAAPPERKRPSEPPSVDAELSKKIALRQPVYRLIPPKPLRSRPVFLTAVLLILLLIGGAGYLGFTPTGNGLLDRISRGMESLWLGGSRAVPSYRIRDVSAYYVPISTSEKFFILEGKVINGGKADRRGIQVRVTLLNVKSREIAEKTIYAGNVFTDTELRQMDRESIEEAMSRRFDENSDNMDILPDESLPFMAVFFDVRESVASYQVAAIGSP